MCRTSIITHQPPTSEETDGSTLCHRTRRRGRQRPAAAASNVCIVISVAVVATVTLMAGSQNGGIVVSGFSSPRHRPSSSATSSAAGSGRPICNRPRPAPVASLLDVGVNSGMFSRRKNMCFARTLLGAAVEESAATSAESTVVVNGDGGSSSMAVNGDGSASLSVNGESSTGANGASAIPDRYMNDPNIPDAPLPTVNGGYAHTKASRAKIAAANKGKTPWNKGKARSEEVKARIAAGVRRKNRERLLKKIADMGLTEEEYNAQKKEEKRKREAERRARKTEKGGYRPTQETKDKISAILKEKWAKGEVKKRAPSTGQRRKGFKHSEETKQKIRESLRKRWADDPEYRAKKEESARKQNTTTSSREKIANTLKKKWEDPKFRAYMMEKIKQRKKPAKVSDEHRAKISAAMKKKWQDEKYREKAVGNIRKAAATRPSRPTARRKPASVQATKPKQRELKNGIIAMVPETAPTKKAKKKAVRKTTAKTKTKTKTAATTATTKRKKKVAPKKKRVVKATDEGPGDFGPIEAVKPLTQPKRVFEDLDDDNDDDLDDFGGNGDLAQLRHERRDLFDLLYGDEDDIGANDAAIYDKQSSAAPVAPRKVQKTTSRGRPAAVSPIERARVPANAEESDTLAAVAAAAGGAMPRADRRDPVFSPSLPNFSFDDDDDEDDSLDNFDPYGLEDF